MKPFERNLLAIQSKYADRGQFVFANELGISDYDLRFLEAKQLVTRSLYGDNLYVVQLTDAGITYFQDKRQASAKYWKDHLVNFVVGFVSGLATGILLAWLLGVLQLSGQTQSPPL